MRLRAPKALPAEMPLNSDRNYPAAVAINGAVLRPVYVNSDMAT